MSGTNTRASCASGLAWSSWRRTRHVSRSKNRGVRTTTTTTTTKGSRGRGARRVESTSKPGPGSSTLPSSSPSSPPSPKSSSSNHQPRSSLLLREAYLRAADAPSTRSSFLSLSLQSPPHAPLSHLSSKKLVTATRKKPNGKKVKRGRGTGEDDEGSPAGEGSAWEVVLLRANERDKVEWCLWENV